MIARPGEETILAIDRGAGKRDDSGRALVTGLNLDVIFPVLHGPYGEDGTIQGLLELANVPYVGAGVLASAVGMDKGMMKIVFAGQGLPVCPYRIVRWHHWQAGRAAMADDLVRELGFPVFVKPANLGSSVGIHKVKERAALLPALEDALRYDTKLVVERGIPGRDVEIALLGRDPVEASVPGEIRTRREFYDYEAKYVDEDTELLVPAPVSESLAAALREASIRAFHALEGDGFARVDFLVHRATSEFYINELNSLPGFTEVSMYPRMWEATGLPYPALLDRLIELALERHRERAKLETQYRRA
jgi:D-alanine-D-alanine ligase